MKVLFLGTCAADFSPKLNEEFKNCFDKDARRSSSVLLNDRILIDCGIHTLDSLRIAKVDVTKITDVFITHLHPDHFQPESLKRLVKASGNRIRIRVKYGARIDVIEGAEIIKMTPYETYTVYDGIMVTGLDSNHDPNSFPQWLYFDDGKKRFLYALDGAWILNRTYYWLQDKKLSALVIDATIGDIVGNYRIAEHNSLAMIRLMVPSMKIMGIIDEKTTIYLSHIAPSLHKPHGVISKELSTSGLIPAYDGLTTEF